MELSVIVPTYNRSNLLSNSLQSLVNQTLDKSLYEIIVVNNNSTDDTQEIAEKFIKKEPNMRLVFERNQGVSNARNRGWREAHGDFVAYTDDDTKVASDWCDRILKAFRTVVPTPVAVGGAIYPWYEIHPPDWFSDEFEIRSWGESAGFLEVPRAHNGFSGANMAFKRSILEQYGGFSLNYGIIGDEMRLGGDTELFTRIYKNCPFFWYDPDIKVSHWVPASTMSVSYRIKRAFKGGIAWSHLNNRKIFSLQYLKSWACLCLFIIKAPLKMWRRKTGLQTECVMILQELASSLGYLIGH